MGKVSFKPGKAIVAFLMIAALILPTCGLFGQNISAHAEGGVILKLHYHREDGDYEPWDVWLWPAGGEGSGYAGGIVSSAMDGENAARAISSSLRGA